MEKKIINEIFRIKLLSGYNTKSTLSENIELIDEDFKTSLIGSLKSSGKNMRFVATDGKLLTNIDEVVEAYLRGALKPRDEAKLLLNSFESTTNPILRKDLAKKIGNDKSFIKKYGDLSEVEFKKKLKSNNPSYDTKKVDDLWDATKKRKGTSRKTKKAATAAEESSKRAKEAATAAEESSKRAMQAADAAELAAKNAGKGSAKEAMAADPKGFYQSLKSYTIKGISWTYRTISRIALWRLAKIAGISWLVWWAFFKDDGFTLTDEDDGGGDTGGEEKKIQIGGGEITDNEGNKYKECENTYYKGCVNKKGNTDIQKAQDCLGITPNGFFNQETEDALMKKINKKSFSLSDLDDICAKSYGGGSFSA